MDINTIGFASLIALVSTIVLTVLAYKFIIPESRRAKLNKLGQFLHDAFNFKFLIIEKILKFFYVLATISVVCCGICMIFAITSYHSSYFGTHTEWYGIYGIIIAIVGPIVLRIAYECIMLTILLVKNVIEINKKMKSETETDEYVMPKFKDLVAKENFDFLKKNGETFVAPKIEDQE